ncbi:MAG: glycosyltransferase family 39 protein [Polyangiaceae bacterium]|nr:glycosyltransferase family 39 protein [Polyangiaceae bacterium]
MTYFILLAITAAVQLYVLRRLRFGWFIVAMVWAGTLVEVSYLAYTSISERNYDAASQLLYIDEIAEHRRLPPVSIFCTACGHPPLYYALAALWSKAVLAGGWIPRELGLQWLSLLLFSGFVVFALLLLRSSIERAATFRLAAALVVFWPSSIINSVRVHNDALATTLMIASMYFIARWDRHERRRDFCLAVAATALALLTKATGYAMAATLLMVAALRVRSTRFCFGSAKRLVAATLILLGTALLAVSFRETMYPHTLCQRVLGRACDVPSDYFVSNRPINYLYFELHDFVSTTSSMAYPPKQDYFWNVLVKSSLFGVMPLGKDFEGTCYSWLAVFISVLSLAIIAICMTVLPSIGSVNWQTYRVFVISSASMVTLLVALRIMLPTPFHEDFRHIFAIVVPFCLAYAKAVERLGRWSGVLYKAGIAVGFLMIASSVAFFVRMP